MIFLGCVFHSDFPVRCIDNPTDTRRDIAGSNGWYSLLHSAKMGAAY